MGTVEVVSDPSQFSTHPPPYDQSRVRGQYNHRGGGGWRGGHGGHGGHRGRDEAGQREARRQAAAQKANEVKQAQAAARQMEEAARLAAEALQMEEAAEAARQAEAALQGYAVLHQTT